MVGLERFGCVVGFVSVPLYCGIGRVSGAYAEFVRGVK